MDVTPTPPPDLGAALRFFQCGSDLEIQGNAEALRRLARLLEDAAGSPAGGRLIVGYLDPEGRSDAAIRVENVAEMTAHTPVGRNWVVPVASVAGVIWVVILPITGLVALIWLLINGIS